MTGFLFGVCGCLIGLAGIATWRYHMVVAELEDAVYQLDRARDFVDHHVRSTGVITVWKQQTPERQP